MNPVMPHQVPPQYRAQAQAHAQAQASAQQYQRMHGTPGKRGQHNPAQIAKQNEQAARLAEAQQAALNAEAEKRRTYIPTDLSMPPDVEELIVGDGVDQYNKIREVEAKMDGLILRKKIELQDPLRNRSNRYSTLKLWISNTVENQPWQVRDLEENAFDFNIGVEATYKVKIVGQVIDEELAGGAGTKAAQDGEDTMDVDGGGKPNEGDSTPPKKRVKMSHFFKAITIDFDRNKALQPDNMAQIEWKKPKAPPQVSGPTGAASATLPAEADFDQLEFERKSDENINCTINFYRDEFPERYSLSKELSELLDAEEMDRAGIVEGIWEYTKLMNLQHEEEKRFIKCDERLMAVFKQPGILFPDLPKLLEPHLRPAKPLSLQYTIRCDPEFHADPKPTVYVLRVPAVPGSVAPSSSTTTTVSTSRDPSTATPEQEDVLSPATILTRLTSKSDLATLSELNSHQALLIQAIAASKAKRDFYNDLASDPVTFTKKWMISQRRDLETLLSESGRNEGDWASQVGVGGGSRAALRGQWLKGGKDGVWSGREVQDAVGVMVSRMKGNAGAGGEGKAF